MKELFIVESGSRRNRLCTLITLITAALLLIVFAGCTPAKGPSVDKSKPWADVKLAIDTSNKYAPTFAIWILDVEAGEAATLYATAKAAQGKLANRPGALPVWNAAGKGSDADVSSSATPSGAEADLVVQIPDSFKGKKVSFFIEANVSFDYNDFYKEGLKSGETGYNDVNGQPSVVWQADADVAAAPKGTLAPAVAGHGDVLGEGGGIEADMANVTTAASIFRSIAIDYDMGGK